MLEDRQQEKRLWILDALDYLETFVADDHDYHGDRAYESRAVGYQRAVVREGKYRVVFLGAFNVGKSTAINAFLGGPYLPMDIEECTSRLTFIQRGDTLRLSLALDAPATSFEIEALGRALADIDAQIDAAPDNRELNVHCPGQAPGHMRHALTPLITVAADEEYPHLASLREKTEALTLHVPNEALEGDIVFIDTPGVHSMSETRQKITYDIIEHCHLVIAFVDSAFVGNIHDINFIKRIITCRGRRVFFVLNKADKLENEEIDPRATHGPAAQLVETFKRNGIPENADIFFLAGYRALRALELEQGRLALSDALDDNKLLIPTAVTERILGSGDPVRDLSAYLMGQSRFPHLKERLLDYLLNENKANAVFALADRFVYERADDYLIGIRNALALARDPSKFDELRGNRQTLVERIESIRGEAALILERYRCRCQGGQVDGIAQEGYVARMKALLTEDAVEARVVVPLIEWLRRDGNLKQARREDFKPLSARLEHQVDTFVSEALTTVRELVESNETETADAIARHIGQARELRAHMTEPEQRLEALLQGSVSGEYVAFGAGGAVVGAMTGAVVGSVAPIVGTAIGAGLGGVLGAVMGFLARLAWSEERWIRKLTPVIRQNALRMMLSGDDNGPPPIARALGEYLERRAAVFQELLEGELNNALDTIQRECDALLEREAEIRAERDAVIARLEPKEARLAEIRSQAQVLLEDTLVS